MQDTILSLSVGDRFSLEINLMTEDERSPEYLKKLLATGQIQRLYELAVPLYEESFNDDYLQAYVIAVSLSLKSFSPRVLEHFKSANRSDRVRATLAGWGLRGLISEGLFDIDGRAIENYVYLLRDGMRLAEPSSIRWSFLRARIGHAYFNCGLKGKASDVLLEIRTRHKNVEASDRLSIKLDRSDSNLQGIGNRYAPNLNPDSGNYSSYRLSLGILTTISRTGLVHGSLFRLQPNPKCPSEALTLATMYLLTGRRPEAMTIAKDLGRHDAENFDIWILIISAAISANSREQAIKALKQLPTTRSTTPPEVKQALLDAIDNPRIQKEKLQKLLNLLVDGVDAYPFDARIYKHFFLECEGRWKWQYVLKFQREQMQQANRLRRALRLKFASS